MKTYELLKKKKNWTRHKMAANKRGETVDALDPNACCWCIHGAILKCYPVREVRLSILDRLKALILLRYGKPIDTPDWNDLHATYHEVVEFMREIER